ncbi:MAG: hypothetical protein N4A37_00555 [Prolixibacteraceae bacterium]|jgi:hypothetical protein|nr:hypothetical protein [Prolixibacteraceae bacterium]
MKTKIILSILIITITTNLSAKEKNLDRNLRAASRWIKVARIQSTNPIDGTEKSSISGTLNLQADINHTGDQQYFATFSFGVRSGNKVTIKPLLVEYGGATIHKNSSTAITWNVYKDKQGMHYLWLQQPQYSSYGVFNYEQIGCREYWTIENPPSDYELVWSSSDGERQVSNGYFNNINTKGNIDVERNVSVKGKISASEIRVEDPQTADFVFEENYNLKDLDEVESFITRNKHLPDVPSAKKMIKEGTDLAQMNRILLQKIEELTLYTIKQQKELEKQKKEIIKLKNNK